MINFLKIIHAKTIVNVEEMKNMLYLELRYLKAYFQQLHFCISKWLHRGYDIVDIYPPPPPPEPLLAYVCSIKLTIPFSYCKIMNVVIWWRFQILRIIRPNKNMCGSGYIKIKKQSR